MKILIAHNYYQLSAGEDAVVEAEVSLLRSHHHQVELFGVHNDSIQGVKGQLQAAASVVYSFGNKQRLYQKIQQFRPDVVHVHNFFPLLSPSLYDACQAAKVPVVQTLHNYRLVCPSATLFRQDKICEDCVGKTLPLPGIIHRCYRDSTLHSAAIATMIATHNLRKTWQHKVAAYITLTNFQRDKMVASGLPAEKVHVKPNFLFQPASGDADRSASDQPYALYVGRLWAEKGIATVIDAYSRHDISLPLKVVGDGVLKEELQEKVRRSQLDHRVEFLGWQPKSEVLQLITNARFLLFSSQWYETFGLSLIESFACATPVIASRLGGIAEIVADGETGLLFNPGEADDLAEKMLWAIGHPAAMVKMGQRGHQVYQQTYTPEANYRQLMSIYEKVQM